MSFIAHYEADGVPIAPDDAEAVVLLTIGGGVDTTTSVTSAALLHLSRHPADRQRLVAEPDLLDSAIEEFLRVYPPARTHARTAVRDTELGGCPVAKGDRVLLSEVSANHDESAFPDADRFVIDRFPNRHVAFGLGIHRCPGSHLARAQFKDDAPPGAGAHAGLHRARRRRRRVHQLVGDRRVGATAGDLHARPDRPRIGG